MWEKVTGDRVDYVNVLANGVCVGRHYGSPMTDNAGTVSFEEFLAGRFQDIIVREHGQEVLDEVIARVREKTQPASAWDVFISYVYRERATWEPLVQELERRGISVFQDHREIETFDSITERLEMGLSASRVFLAFWSPVYPTRRICQWELTAAYTAAEAGTIGQVLVVLTPEVDIKDIPLPRIRDLIIGESSTPNVVAEAVARRLAERPPRFGEISQEWPPWYPAGRRPQRPNIFVGRYRELWRLHGELRMPEAGAATGRFGHGHAQVVGLPGIGKTMLVQEYATRFRSTYPGGVIWFEVPATRTERVTAWRNLLFQLGQDLEIDGLSEATLERQIADELAAREKDYLWVIDGVSADVTLLELRSWLAISEPGAAVITADCHKFVDAIGGAIELGHLEPRDSLELFTSGQEISQEEGEAARLICEGLGHHPLAIAVAGSYVAKSPMVTFDSFHNQLAHPARDHLERAESLVKRLGFELPTGAETSITSVLLQAVDGLSDEGQKVLQVAAILASAAIPTSVLEMAFMGERGQEPAPEALEFGLMECQAQSLIDSSDGIVSVHGIVSRTVRYHTEPDILRDIKRRLVPLVFNYAERLLGTQSVRDQRMLAPHILALLSKKEMSFRHHNITAAVCRTCGRPADAVRCSEEALLLARTAEEEHVALDELAGAYNAAGRHDDARRVHVDELLPKLEQELASGDRHMEVRRLLGNIAGTLTRAGETDRAEQVLALAESRVEEKKLLQIRSAFDAIQYLSGHRGAATLEGIVAAGSASNADQMGTVLRKAQLLEQRGQRGAAIHDLTRAVEEAKQPTRLGPDHAMTIGLMHELGRMLNTEGEYEKALSLNRRVHEWRSKNEGETHPHTLAAGQNYADSLVGLRQPEAVEFCRRLLANKRAPGTSSSRSLSLGVGALMRALLTDGRLDDARQLAQEYIDEVCGASSDNIAQLEAASILLELELLALTGLEGALRPLEEILGLLVRKMPLRHAAQAVLTDTTDRLSKFRDDTTTMCLLAILLEGLVRLAPNFGDDGTVAREAAYSAVAFKVQTGEATPASGARYFGERYFEGDVEWILKVRETAPNGLFQS